MFNGAPGLLASVPGCRTAASVDVLQEVAGEDYWSVCGLIIYCHRPNKPLTGSTLSLPSLAPCSRFLHCGYDRIIESGK